MNKFTRYSNNLPAISVNNTYSQCRNFCDQPKNRVKIRKVAGTAVNSVVYLCDPTLMYYIGGKALGAGLIYGNNLPENIEFVRTKYNDYTNDNKNKKNKVNKKEEKISLDKKIINAAYNNKKCINQSLLSSSLFYLSTVSNSFKFFYVSNLF